MCGFCVCRTTERSSAEGLLEPAAVKRRRAGARERLKVHPAGEAVLLPARAGAAGGGALTASLLGAPWRAAARGGGRALARRLLSCGPIGPGARPSPSEA